MSWDCYVTYTAPQTTCLNLTYNLGPMLRLAGISLRDLSERAGDNVSLLRSAITDMEAEPDKYKHLNPSNGWGTYEGCLEFLRQLLRLALDHPDANVEIH